MDNVRIEPIDLVDWDAAVIFMDGFQSGINAILGTICTADLLKDFDMEEEVKNYVRNFMEYKALHKEALDSAITIETDGQRN